MISLFRSGDVVQKNANGENVLVGKQASRQMFTCFDVSGPCHVV